MSKNPLNREKKDDNFRLDRRDFLLGGLALAASPMLPNVAGAAPAKRQQSIPRRKLGGTQESRHRRQSGNELGWRARPVTPAQPGSDG